MALCESVVVLREVLEGEGLMCDQPKTGLDSVLYAA